MARSTGTSLPLSLPRRYLCDLVHFAQKVPSVIVQRRMDLAVLARARASAAPRPSWLAVFTKAYAMVAQAWPRLRQAYLSFPRPHLYQHPHSVASVALERTWLDDETTLFYAPIAQPESLGLSELDRLLRQFKDQPMERIGAFRRCLWQSRLPRPVRRGLWWLTLNALGQRRAERLGTYAVSAFGALGAEALKPLLLLTSTLTYGVIGRNGAVDVRICYDPRALDGPTAARVLADLERVLTHEIVAELRYLEGLAEAA